MYILSKRCSAVILLKLSTVRIFFTLTVQALSKRAVKSKQCSPTVVAVARSYTSTDVDRVTVRMRFNITNVSQRPLN